MMALLRLVVKNYNGMSILKLKVSINLHERIPMLVQTLLLIHMYVIMWKLICMSLLSASVLQCCSMFISLQLLIIHSGLSIPVQQLEIGMETFTCIHYHVQWMTFVDRLVFPFIRCIRPTTTSYSESCLTAVASDPPWYFVLTDTWLSAHVSVHVSPTIGHT